MTWKIITGLLAMAIMVIFVGVVFVKLKEISLGAVILIGVAMMVYEFVETLKEKD